MFDERTSSSGAIAGPRGEAESLGGDRTLAPSGDDCASRQIRTVAFATAEMMHAQSVAQLVAMLESACRRLFPFDSFCAYEYDCGANTFARIQTEDPAAPEASSLLRSGLERAVVERRAQRLSADDQDTIMSGGTSDPARAVRSGICLPVVAEDEVLGAFALESRSADCFDDYDVEVAELLASVVGIALSNMRLQAERRVAERAHRQSESRFRAMFEQFPLSVQIFDPQGRTLAVNGAWEQLFGMTIEDVRGFNPLHDPQLAPIRDYLRRGFAGEIVTIPPHPFNPRVLISEGDGTSEGRQVWLEVTVWPVRGGDGEIREVIVVHRDVSDRLKAEEALRASEASYRTIFELAGDAMFLHDVESGAILDANQKACELHGYSIAELRAGGVALISDGTPPFNVENARDFIRMAAVGLPQLFEWKVRNRAGDRFWVEVSLHRVHILGQDRIVAGVRNITERKAAEKALQEAHAELERRVEERTAELGERTAELARAEERFRAIVEASPTPLLISRISDGTILYANDRVEALVGLPAGSIAGRKTPDFYFDPSNREQVMDLVRREGSLRDFELRIKTENGPRWVSLSVQRLDFAGEPSVATSMIDITSRKETEQALRASEESYRGLFDNLVELVYIQDLEGRFLNVNEAVIRAYGYSRDELIGQTPDILAAPGLVDLEDTMARFGRAVGGEHERFQWWGRRKDGSIFPKEVVLKRSTYFGRDVVIAVARDITDRLKAEQALRRSEEHFRLLIENSSDLATILDEDGVARYQSPSSEQVIGYGADEMTGKRGFAFIHPDDLPMVQKALKEAMQNPGVSRVAEYRFRQKDGSWRVLHSTARRLMPDDASAGVIVNTRDITARVSAERTLRMQKTLLEAQGEASIDGILVVSPEGKILSFNRRFQEMWSIPPDVLSHRSDENAVSAVLAQLADPGEFQDRIRHLYAHRYEEARDEILLKDGRVFDRYTAPLTSTEGEYYGRVWFFRDVTREKRHAREMERELEIGREIQQGFLPSELPQPAGWEVAAHFQPATQVAGDFYDAFQLANGRLGILVADVRGKGVGASLFMALFRSLLRAYAERASNSRTPTAPTDASILLDAIGATNDYITRLHKSAHMFASVFFGLLDPEHGTLSYVNAGHEPPVVLRASGVNGRLAPTGPALGVLAEASFTADTTQMEPGEILFMYTDGVTEARNVAREFFTEERLLALLKDPPPSAAVLLEHVQRALVRHAGDAPPSDDVTLLAVRRRR